MRGLRVVRGGVPGRRDLPRGRPRTTAPSRPARATRRFTRSTRRGASSAATAKRPARSRPSSWARTTSSRSTATRTSSGTRPTCWCRRDVEVLSGPCRHRLPRPGAGGHDDRRSRRYPWRFRERPAASRRSIPRWPSGSASAMSPTSDGRYEPLPAPVHFIKGNNDGFDAIASGTLPDNLHFIANGRLTQLGGLRVAGLGGTFAPTWYDTAAARPAASGQGDAEGDRAGRQAAAFRAGRGRGVSGARRGIDVFLTHEAPRPYIVGGRAGRRGMDAGKTPINEVLAAMQPRLHLFGHHHRFTRAGAPGRAIRRPRPRVTVVSGDRSGAADVHRISIDRSKHR